MSSVKNFKIAINEIIDDYNLDILFLVCLILFGIYIFFIAPILYVTTTDAVVDGKLMNLTSRVSGQISQVYIMKDQEVKKGDLLVEINPIDYQNELIKIETELEINKEKLKMMGIPDSEISNNEQTNNQETSQNQDELEEPASTPPKYRQGTNSITNYSKTYEPETIQEKNLARKKIAMGDAVQNMSDMTPQPQEIAIPKPVIDKSQIDISNDTVESVQRLIKSLNSQKEETKRLISLTRICAPRDGIVSGISIKSGDIVNSSDVICTIIPKQVWVIARVHPTKLPQIRIGQFVNVKIPGYRRTFKGSVTSVDKTMKVYQIKPEDEVTQINSDGQVINEPTPAYQIKIDFIEDYSDFNIPPDTEVVAKIKVQAFF